MLLADNHKDVWVFVYEEVISCILNKGGAEENDVVKLPPEGASKLVYKVLCLPRIRRPHDEGIERQLSWVHIVLYLCVIT